MKYDRFEQLPVWQAAMDFADRVYSLTGARWFRQPGDLADQLRRAALSISNNIAEGFERGSTSELLQFLYYARGSAGESRSMLHFLSRRWSDTFTEQGRIAGNSRTAVERPSAAAGTAVVSTQPPPPDASASRAAQAQVVRARAAQAQAASPLASARNGVRFGAAGSEPHSEISDLKSEVVALTALAESCSRQIRAWADSLQNTDISGQRHLNDKTRSQFEARRRSSEFMRQIDEVVRKRLAASAAAPDAAGAAALDAAAAVSPYAAGAASPDAAGAASPDAMSAASPDGVSGVSPGPVSPRAAGAVPPVAASDRPLEGAMCNVAKLAPPRAGSEKRISRFVVA